MDFIISTILSNLGVSVLGHTRPAVRKVCTETEQRSQNNLQPRWNETAESPGRRGERSKPPSPLRQDEPDPGIQSEYWGSAGHHSGSSMDSHQGGGWRLYWRRPVIASTLREDWRGGYWSGIHSDREPDLWILSQSPPCFYLCHQNSPGMVTPPVITVMNGALKYTWKVFVNSEVLYTWKIS